jgi:hypothetical protein
MFAPLGLHSCKFFVSYFDIVTRKNDEKKSNLNHVSETAHILNNFSFLPFFLLLLKKEEGKLKTLKKLKKKMKKKEVLMMFFSNFSPYF